MKWLNEPLIWQEQSNILQITSDKNTDFWRKTHFGFIRDNGHFYYDEIRGNFTAKVKVSGQYQNLYDQAGLMIRLDKENWLKFGVELVNGIQQVSAVVTRDYSDWSIAPMPHNPSEIWLRVTRKNSTVELHYSLDDQQYFLLRMTYLTSLEMLKVGIMSASPEGEGFVSTFENLAIKSI